MLLACGKQYYKLMIQMFSCSKKDKRLSSAKKILMSQLGKRKRRAGNSSGEQSSTRDRDQQENTTQPSEDVAGGRGFTVYRQIHLYGD